MIDKVIRSILRKCFKLRYPVESGIIRYITARKLTYCGYNKLVSIAESINEVKKEQVYGSYIEAGVALGGSAILIAKIKNPASHLYLYDAFGMIPPPSANDGSDAHERYKVIADGKSKGLGNDQYYGYMENLEDVVRRNLENAKIDLNSSNVHLIRGFLTDTLNVLEPVAFAHIDVDWYDSVRICIDRITPHLSPGGIMIFDDYHSYSGCRRAVDEFLGSHSKFIMVDGKRSAVIKRSRG